MAQFKQWFEQDFTEKIEIRHCESVMFTGDDQGAIVGVRLYDDGTPYSSGGVVTGAVKRYDGGVVALTGTLSGNAASVVIPAAALAYSGPIGVRIVLAQGGQTATVLKAIYTVDDNTGADVDPGTIIPSITDLITAIEDAIASIPADYSALLAAVAPDFNTSTDYGAGDYAWYDGTLYRFIGNHPAGSWTGNDVTVAVVGNDLSDFKGVISEGTRNKWVFGDKTFTRSESVSFSPPLPAGTYTFSAVVTSEASGTNCLVTFYNVGSTEILASGNITKSSGNERNAITVTLNSPCESIILYSGGWSSGSVGYSAEYKNIQLESGGNISPYIPPITAVDRVARTECEYLQNALSEDVRNKIVPSEFISGKYIYYVNGTLSDLIDLSASPYIAVEPNVLYKLSNFTDYSGTDARGLAFYDRSKTFISGIQYHGESVLTGIVPNGAYYMRVTVSTNMLESAILYCTEQKGTEASIAMFSKVGFCGDSYVAAQLWSSSGLIGDRPNLSWGSVIGRLCDIEAKIYASSGADTNTWQTRQDCLPAVLSEQTPCGLYIFCMGINDATHVTLGSMSDITSHSSYTDYPNTFYGNYGKIIEQVQAYSSGSKIILMTPFHPDYNARYVTPLTEISEYYGIAMINTQESALCNTNFVNATIGGHPTSVQHSQMANNIIGLVADCIIRYYNYFVSYYGIN